MIQFDEYFRELKTPSRDVCFQETGRIEDWEFVFLLIWRHFLSDGS